MVLEPNEDEPEVQNAEEVKNDDDDAA